MLGISVPFEYTGSPVTTATFVRFDKILATYGTNTDWPGERVMKPDVLKVKALFEMVMALKYVFPVLVTLKQYTTLVPL